MRLRHPVANCCLSHTSCQSQTQIAKVKCRLPKSNISAILFVFDVWSERKRERERERERERGRERERERETERERKRERKRKRERETQSNLFYLHSHTINRDTTNFTQRFFGIFLFQSNIFCHLKLDLTSIRMPLVTS